MKRIIFFLFSVCVLYAEEQNIAMSNMPQEITQTDVVMQNAISDASDKEIASQNINDFFDGFASEYDIEYGIDKNEKTFYNGKAVVALDDTDPNFAKALNLAFDEALIDMQASFVRDMYGKQSTSVVQKFFSDDSSNAREFEKLPPEGKLSQLLNKVTTLVGAKLDQYLEEMSINTQGLSEERKKVLLADSLVQKIHINALGNMRGLVPVQTAMLKNSNGKYEVGVIAVVSPKTKQIAEDIRLKRASLVSGKGKDINQFLPKNSKDYLNELGIRLVYDANGMPVIMSYGQWSYLKGEDSYTNSRKQQNAEQTAIARADSAISAFVNSSITFKQDQELSKDIETSITQRIAHNDTEEQENSARNIIDRTTREAKLSSQIALKGIRTIKRWNALDDNGIEYVGAVRAYSYNFVKNADKIIVPVQKTQAGNGQNAKSGGVDVSKKSTVVNSMDDF